MTWILVSSFTDGLPATTGVPRELRHHVPVMTPDCGSGVWFAERAALVGTVAVITGGAGGLGSSIAVDLAANGSGGRHRSRRAGAVKIDRVCR